MRLFVRGQRREIRFSLTASTVGEVLARSPSRTVRRRERIRMRLRENGRVRCRVRGGKSTPPYFRGRLRETDDGVVLQGVVRESRSSGFMTAVFSFFTVFMAVIAVACVLSRPVVVPGLVVCSLAALAFGPLGFMLREQRIDQFRWEADELVEKMRRLLDVVSSRVPPH